jgi:hypothetical protein
LYKRIHFILFLTESNIQIAEVEKSKVVKKAAKYLRFGLFAKYNVDFSALQTTVG